MIELREVSFSYNGKKILDNINLKVEEGEFLAILGPNGAGKSTLLKCMAGILKCEGDIEVMGKEISSYTRNELAKIISYVPQKVMPTFLRVFDMVLLGRRPYMGLTPSKRDLEIVNNVLRIMGIKHLSTRPTKSLSGGELQKVAIARALAQDTPIILLDEPTNNLDPKSQIQVMELLKELARENRTVVAVMHDINLALRFAERFVFIRDGKVVGVLPKGELNEEIFKSTFDLNVEFIKATNGSLLCNFHL
ncbi:ABC transporter ATP-binding protein [Pyrococcus sp. ST04]|uniref:ABC transporter ATP-binding protein n=1 Tax=Pyrococcus sp. ST04 TaxID=1183377 RepID=UPI0002605CE2|nr:putative iron (III) ABC transporter ATP-binding protein [Pyrococcus sp. ST04]